MEIKIENWEPRKVAFVRHLGPIKSVGTAWDRLCTWAARRDCLWEVLKCSESVTMIRKRLLRNRFV